MTLRPETDHSELQDAGRAAARLAKALELALADVGASLPQYRLLAFLSGGPERATALAGMLEVSPPTLTALVDGTVAKGLVERRTADEDRRCVRHVLTPAGEQALATADEAVTARLALLLEELPAGQRRKAVEGLELLGAALANAAAKANAAVKAAKG